MSSKRPEGRRGILPFVIIGGVLLAAIAIVFLMQRTDGDEGKTPASQPSANFGAPPPRRAEQPGALPPHVKGDVKAPVVLEEFSDFQCPACAARTSPPSRRR